MIHEFSPDRTKKQKSSTEAPQKRNVRIFGIGIGIDLFTVVSIPIQTPDADSFTAFDTDTDTDADAELTYCLLHSIPIPDAERPFITLDAL
jgi:hypothetical protein